MSIAHDSVIPGGKPAGAFDLSQQWQIPLLGVALVLFIISLVQLRPEPFTPSFEEQIDQLRGLVRSGLNDLAVRDASNMLLSAEWEPAQLAGIYQLLSEASYRAEADRSVHSRPNAEGIIRSLAYARKNGYVENAEDLRRSGAAWEWLGEPEKALANYSRSLALGLDADLLDVDRRVIELKSSLGLISVDERSILLDEFLARADTDAQALLWAARERAMEFTRKGQLEQAWDLLGQVKAKLSGRRESLDVEVLSARILHQSGRMDEAEQVLRSVRARLQTHRQTFAEATWLLGRISLEEDRTYEALSFFRENIITLEPGPYQAASLLGAAEAQAQLHEFALSAQSYGQLIDMMPFGFTSSVVSPNMIRASLAVLHETLRNRGDHENALTFIRLANRVVQYEDDKIRALYQERLAQAHIALAEAMKSRRVQGSPARPDFEQVDRAVDEASGEAQVEAQDEPDATDPIGVQYIAAADAFLALSQLLALDEEGSTQALWNAADYYDRAGETRKVIDVLSEFVETHKSSSQMAVALLRLGQAHQAMQEYDAAIEAYLTNIEEYTHTPAALGSVVPLAQAYLSKGEDHAESAEQTLRSLLNQSSSPEEVVTPSAKEYRQALFLLGDIYVRQKRYEEAITVLDEGITRYPDDADAPLARFVLANSYRLSGLALRDQASEAETSVHKQRILDEAHGRLDRARDLFSSLLAASNVSVPESQKDTWSEYLRLSAFYHADCLYDLGHYSRALSAYEQAGWRYHDSPNVLSAYVQMVNCHLMLGHHAEAVTALRRAHQLAGRIPEEKFQELAGGRTRRQWEDFLQTVEESPLFQSETTAIESREMN